MSGCQGGKAQCEMWESQSGELFGWGSGSLTLGHQGAAGSRGELRFSLAEVVWSTDGPSTGNLTAGSVGKDLFRVPHESDSPCLSILFIGCSSWKIGAYLLLRV